MSDTCETCWGTGLYWSCQEYGCDPEGCWQIECEDCDHGC